MNKRRKVSNRTVELRYASRAFVLISVSMCLTSCGFVHDEPIDGPYRLVAIDVDEDMAVCYEIPDGCIGRVPAAVYAVGFNAKYLVAAAQAPQIAAVLENATPLKIHLS